MPTVNANDLKLRVRQIGGTTYFDVVNQATNQLRLAVNVEPDGIVVIDQVFNNERHGLSLVISDDGSYSYGLIKEGQF